EAVAVAFEDEELTYAELNQKANRLARQLQKLGVHAETRVVICARRSMEMVIGLLAIHKSGGAYVPLDPSYPEERVAFMLEDSQAPVLLTQREIGEKLTVPAGTQVVFLDEALWELDANDTESQEGDATQGSAASRDGSRSGATPDNLAYVIYTSG